MSKTIGYISTVLLAATSLSAIGIAAWYYHTYDFNNYEKNSLLDLTPYVNSLKIVLLCDALVFFVCFIGFFYMIKPHSFGGAKCYNLQILLLVIFKIIIGALFYYGVNDDGKKWNDNQQTIWDNCEDSSNCTHTDEMKSWRAARVFEIVSIILFAIFGIISAHSVMKISKGK